MKPHTLSTSTVACQPVGSAISPLDGIKIDSGPPGRQVSLAAALVLALALGIPAQAELLVYEGFDCPTGTAAGNGMLLDGQGAAERGFAEASAWSVVTTGSLGPANPSATVYQEGNLSGVIRIPADAGGGGNAFDGTVDNLPTSGGYFGSATTPEGSDQSTTDHMFAWRPLDPGVTATFTDGSTTWFSYVVAKAWGRNGRAPSFAIGADRLIEDRGDTALGEAIGAGGSNKNGANAFFPQFFDQVLGSAGEEGGNFLLRHSAGARGGKVPSGDYLYFHGLPTASNPAEEYPFYAVPNIIVGKITWRDGAVPDEISVVRFLETDTLSEANFDAAILAQPMLSSLNWLPQNQPVLDQSKFDTVSFGGGRYFADEIRIATTFEDVVGAEAGPGFSLSIARNAPNLDFIWNSQGGKLYKLWSSPNLLTAPPTGWTLVQQDIVATPPINTLQILQPADPRMFYVAEDYPAPPVVVFADNFDGPPAGWTTSAAGGTPATGWELGTPTVVGPAAANTAPNCCGTNLDSIYGYETDIWLRSPVIDLTAYTAGNLEFMEFRDIEDNYDSGTIRVLAADDNEVLGVIATGIDGTFAGWQNYSKALPPAAFDEPIRIEFKLVTDDYDDGAFAGWYIDDVVITGSGS